jgi:hypothetical protein
VADGVNERLKPQLEPAANEALHWFCSAKSEALAPAMPMLLMASSAFPEFASVRDWLGLVVPNAWLVKVMLVREGDTPGAVPVPDSVTDCGLSAALSVILTEPTRSPAVGGAKPTEIWQLAPALSEVGQALEREKSLVASILLISSGAFPELLRIRVCDELVVLTGSSPKARLEAESSTIGLATPVPVKPTCCEPEGALSLMVSSP